MTDIRVLITLTSWSYKSDLFYYEEKFHCVPDPNPVTVSGCIPIDFHKILKSSCEVFSTKAAYVDVEGGKLWGPWWLFFPLYSLSLSPFLESRHSCLCYSCHAEALSYSSPPHWFSICFNLNIFLVTYVHIWCKYATIQSVFTLSVTISENDLLQEEQCALWCRKGEKI